MSLKILKAVLDQIKAHAEEAYPEECCGLLIASNSGEKDVVEALRMRNVYPGPKGDRYNIDPLEFFKVDRAVAQRGLSIAGVYHSHPDYPAHLSSYDLEHSFSWYSYVVVSVPKGKVGDVRSWVPDEKRSSTKEEQIQMVQEEVS